jgi:hypothetical protein
MAKNRRAHAPRDRKRPFALPIPKPPCTPEPPRVPPPPSPPGPGCGTGPDPLRLLRKGRGKPR